jgi:nascent polypeptide-associated complex subunit alpha
MFPGVDPKKMQAMMKQMGINQQDVPAKKVIIEGEDSNIIINNPSVVKINMQGQTNFQISGDVSEQVSEDHTSEDIKTLIEKTNCTEEQAKDALDKANGDLTEALLELS